MASRTWRATSPFARCISPAGVSGEIGQSVAASASGVAGACRQGRPLAGIRSNELDLTVETIGVGSDDRRKLAVHLDARRVCRRRIEAHHKCREGTGLVLEYPCHVCVDIDRHDFAGAWAGMNRSGWTSATRLTDHRRHRPQEGDERGHVVRPHVEQRAAARFVVEVGIRMPVLVTRAHERRSRGDRFADEAIVDGLARGLDAGAEYRVGRAAHPDAGHPRRIEHGATFASCRGQRLFPVDRLACSDGCEGHVGMCGRDGQVEDQVHPRIDGGCGRRTCSAPRLGRRPPALAPGRDPRPR